MAEVKRQLISRIFNGRFDDPEFQLRRWKLEVEDYDIFLEFAKGNKKEGENTWDWSNSLRLKLQDQDVENMIHLINEVSKTIRRNAYNQQQTQTEAQSCLVNPFFVTRDNEYIVSLWCNIMVSTTDSGERKSVHETEFRFYKFDSNWKSLDVITDDARFKRDYTGYSPIYTFKLQNQRRIRGLFMNDDADNLDIMRDALTTCVMKDSAAFVDHFRRVSEAKGSENRSSNVGYNKNIPTSGEPATPSVTTNDIEFPF